MVRAITNVVVFDERLYVGNGLARRWVRGVTLQMYERTFARTPQRSGALRAGLEWNVTQLGPRQLEGRVASTAAHSMYVLKGTARQGTQYIYTTLGFADRGLVVNALRRTTPGAQRIGLPGYWLHMADGRGPRFALRVHGQQANNFLLDGYNATARTHRALRPLAPANVRAR